MRFALLGLTFAAGVLSATAADPETFAVKIKKEAKGDKSAVTKSEDGTTTATIEVGGQEKVTKQTTALKFAYTEEILERPADAKKSTKIKRVYTTAQKTKDGTKETLAYEGKTVVIEKKKDKYVFTADGERLAKDDAEDLDKEFNKKPGEVPVETEDFLPAKPVKLNETWKIDAAKLAKNFSTEAPFELDADACTASGKLVKAYKKGGAQFGVMEITITLVPTAFKAGGDSIPLSKGSKLAMVVTIDGCIDGTLPDGEAKMKIKIAIDGEIPNGSLKIVGESTQTETGREVR